MNPNFKRLRESCDKGRDNEDRQFEKSSPDFSSFGRLKSRSKTKHLKRKKNIEIVDRKWVCSQCTFLNSELLPSCEICGSSRSISSGADTNAQGSGSITPEEKKRKKKEKKKRKNCESSDCSDNNDDDTSSPLPTVHHKALTVGSARRKVNQWKLSLLDDEIDLTSSDEKAFAKSEQLKVPVVKVPVVNQDQQEKSGQSKKKRRKRHGLQDFFKLQSDYDPFDEDVFAEKRSRKAVSTDDSDGDKVNKESKELVNRDNEHQMWADKYAPREEASLSVHAKKIKDVKKWIADNLDMTSSSQPAASTSSSFSSSSSSYWKTLRSRGCIKQSVLLLTGPPGCAKSTMIKVIAKSMNLSIVTWEPPISLRTRQLGRSFTRSDRTFQEPRGSNAYETSLKNLKAFFLRSKKYGSLSNIGKKLVVIEELPFLDDDAYRREFSDIVLNIVNNSRFIVIFILTSHHEQQSDLHKIFDLRVLSNPKVAEIKCNPIARTILSKALRRIIREEKLQVPSHVLNQIIESCAGDIRNAIHSLQFYSCQKDTQLSCKVRKRKAKRRKNKEKSSGKRKEKKPTKSLDRQDLSDSDQSDEDISVLFQGRDEAYSLFHALGKVLHAKTESPEEVIKQSDMNPLRFTEFLHYNFLDHVNRLNLDKSNKGSTTGYIDELSAIYEDLSLADVLAQASKNKYGNSLSAVPEEYSSSVASRAYLLFKNQDTKATVSSSLISTSISPLSSSYFSKKRQGSKGPINTKVTYEASYRLKEMRKLTFDIATSLQLATQLSALSTTTASSLFPFSSSSSTSSSHSPSSSSLPVSLLSFGRDTVLDITPYINFLMPHSSSSSQPPSSQASFGHHVVQILNPQGWDVVTRCSNYSQRNELRVPRFPTRPSSVHRNMVFFSNNLDPTSLPSGTGNNSSARTHRQSIDPNNECVRYASVEDEDDIIEDF